MKTPATRPRTKLRARAGHSNKAPVWGAEAPVVAVVAEPCPNLCRWNFGLRTYRDFIYIYIYTHTHTLSIQAHYLPSACSGVKFCLLCCMPESCVNLCRPLFDCIPGLGHWELGFRAQGLWRVRYECHSCHNSCCLPWASYSIYIYTLSIQGPLSPICLQCEILPALLPATEGALVPWRPLSWG